MLKCGTILENRYEILCHLKSGGMGEIYKAKETTLGHLMAIKEMSIAGLPPYARQTAIERFECEARILARFNHPGLPRVSHLFLYGDNYYMVMDFIHGVDLLEASGRRGSPFPEEEVRDWAIQVLNVLEYLHSLTPPVIIRDLKPSNIMLEDTGRIKIIDFGIAKVFDNLSPGTQIHMKGSGTPPFAPLEQYSSSGTFTDVRSDLYALGVTMYFLLTLTLPPPAPEMVVAGGRPTPPRRLNPSISTAMESVVLKAMEIKREARFASARQMREALLSGSGEFRPIGGAWESGAACPVAPSFTERQYVCICTRCGMIYPSTESLCLGCSIPLVMVSRPKPALMIVNPQDGKHMLLIPAGSFWTGSTFPNRNGNDPPRRQVYLPDFYLDRFPVTNLEFARFVEETGYSTTAEQEDAEENWRKWFSEETGQHPVVNVSWYDAQEYCYWAGKRLPTEAEWEKGARSSDGRGFPWGNLWDRNRCNNFHMEESSGKRLDMHEGRGTTPVGCIPGNISPYGVEDMCGNVWEWVADWDQSSANAQATPFKVLKGGCWETEDPRLLRCYSRCLYLPRFFSYHWGFRCARDV